MSYIDAVMRGDKYVSCPCKNFTNPDDEDDEVNRKNLKELGKGRLCVTAGDGKEAIEAFVQERYDLVITTFECPPAMALKC
jgi:hypothetical protein